MRMYKESTAVLYQDDADEITGVHNVADGVAAGRAGENVAALLEELCSERGHPPSPCHDECICGLTRYD